MNPAQLLSHFDRIGEAPDAIPCLRRFILDLAVRGKLVEQDPRDESAAELLRRIQLEKTRLIKLKDVKKEKPLIPLAEEVLPFQLAKSWCWTQLAEVGFINPRNTEANELTASFVPMSLISAEYGAVNKHEVRPWAEIKRGYTHFAEGDVALAKITPCFENGKSTVFRELTGGIGAGTTELHIFRPVGISADYVLIFLKCPHFIESGIPRMTGTAGQKRVPAEYFAYSPFPLPPLAEQHRIVAKVDELMALCDRLEAAQTERESRRDRLVASSLNQLSNGADADTFRDHARFYFNHLPRMTTRTEHIQQLRQTILNLAVCGKLVAQDSNEEPASDLLKRIQAERLGAVNEGKIKKIDPVHPPNVLDFPSGLPSGWEPAYLQSLCISVTDGDHLPPPKADHGIPFLVIGDVRSQTINFKGCRYVAEEYYDALDSIRRPKKGDVLYTLVGSYGIPVMVTDDRPFCVQRHIGILRPSKNIHAGFLSRALESKRVFNQATACATGIAQKTVPLSGLRKILIPLPPLAEQQRIAAKVDELIALCDKLDAQLTITHTDSRRLLEAVLHEALAPAVYIGDP